MCKMNPDFEEDVRTEGKKKVLYLRIVKALYGCIESALLWYECFVNKLSSMGFKINPYDHCIANKDIDGSQCTIAWYVDDVKVSHKNENVITTIIRDQIPR